MTQPQSPDQAPKRAGTIATAVVGHDAGETDAQAAVVAQRLEQDLTSTGATLIGMQTAEGDSAGIIDGHMDEFPAVAVGVLLAIAGDPRVHRDPVPVVFVTGLGDRAVDLSLRVWVDTADYWPVTFAFTEPAKERLTEAGIGIPFPQWVVHLVQAS